MRWHESSSGLGHLARWLATPQLMHKAVRRRVPTTTFVAAAVSVFVACASDPTGLVRDEAAPLQTDRLRYKLVGEVLQFPGGPVARFQTSIKYGYRNPTTRTIYVVKCETESFRLEKRVESGEWLEVWAGPDYARCLGPPTVIEAGVEIWGSLEIVGYERNGQAGPQFAMADLDGVYRLILLSAMYLDDPADYPDGLPVELEHRYSNEFVLEVE
jgi:hypothetical protein